MADDVGKIPIGSPERHYSVVRCVCVCVCAVFFVLFALAVALANGWKPSWVKVKSRR